MARVTKTKVEHLLSEAQIDRYRETERARKLALRGETDLREAMATEIVEHVHALLAMIKERDEAMHDM